MAVFTFKRDGNGGTGLHNTNGVENPAFGDPTKAAYVTPDGIALHKTDLADNAPKRDVPETNPPFNPSLG